MTIQEQIKENLKRAMLARDTEKISALRSLLAAFTNELVSLKLKPQEPLSDERARAVIKREIKKRRESIDQFTKGNRPDLVAQEEKELAFILPYVPAGLSEEEIKKVAMIKKEELAITDKSKVGVLTGAIMKELAGKAEGSTVLRVVQSLF
jgi:uncharacterized protein YqeY